MREGIAEIVHPVLGTKLSGPWPQPYRVMIVGMGCFWGAERIFWKVPGVINTSVGYCAGSVAWPSYEEVCTSATGHAEGVRVVYDPTKVSDAQILKTFWENHDPTQGDRQGNDRGPQYRSLIAVFDDQQQQIAETTKQDFAKVLAKHGYGPITTQIIRVPENLGSGKAWEDPFYYLAERYHQQYLFHNPDGYCMHGPNGMTCPIGLK